ncbi:MAG: sigma-70 family RNA polymerase sigma factor [Fibrobacteria bacterium]
MDRMIVNMHTVTLNLSHPKYTKLSRKEEIAVATIIRAGGPMAHAAKVKLVNANMKFVVTMARRYIAIGLPMDDLINEGAKGMMLAASRFDPAAKLRFITYAVWWIRQHLLMAAHEQVPNVQTPMLHAVKKKVKDARREQMAAAVRGAAGRETAARARGEEAARLLERYRLLRNPDSVDLIMASGYDLADSADPSAGVAAADVRAMLARHIKSLESVDQEIVQRYFGLNGLAPEPMSVIGRRLGLTHERIRQRKDRVLRLLSYRMKKEWKG